MARRPSRAILRFMRIRRKKFFQNVLVGRVANLKLMLQSFWRSPGVLRSTVSEFGCAGGNFFPKETEAQRVALRDRKDPDSGRRSRFSVDLTSSDFSVAQAFTPG